MYIIFIWLIFQSLFVCALYTISAYNYFNEDDESAPDNEETYWKRPSRPQHLQDYDEEKPCQIEPEDCFVHRGFNRQYKKRDQNQMVIIQYVPWNSFFIWID